MKQLKSLGKKSWKKTFLIISVDATREALNALSAGKLNLTVECNPLLGPELMKAITDYVEGKRDPGQNYH
ncbi:hypothetical protein GCM10020331_099220 [Ectobacillus funiculus]